MTDKCPYCNEDLSNKKSIDKRIKDLETSFPNSCVEPGEKNGEGEDICYVDYSFIGQEYSVLRLGFEYKFDQWRIFGAYIATKDLEINLKGPEKYFKDPKNALENAKEYWELDIKD